MLGVLWILPLLWAVWSAIHPGSAAAGFDLFAPLTLQNFRRGLGNGPVRAIHDEYRAAGQHGAGGAVRAVHAGGVRVRAAALSRQGHSVCRRADPVDDHAGRADGGELQDDRLDRVGGFAAWGSRCHIWGRHSGFSCCGRRSGQCRRIWTTRRSWRDWGCSGGCGRCMCRWRGRLISPTGWCW